MSNISLTASMRSNLLSLQNTSKLMSQTQERLATGKKVNSAIDNPSSYYTAQALNNRASDLSALLDSMGQAISTIKAADEGISAITSFVEQAKAVATSAADTTDADERGAYAAQFNAIRAQIDNLANDSGYKGVNLLKGDSLTVTFNEGRDSQLVINGVTATSAGLSIGEAKTTGDATENWKDAGATGATGAITKAIEAASDAIETLRAHASAFGNNYSIVQTREEFTTNLINVLEEGADKLTLADMNEESANMLALQTRQQLAINSLSLASQAAQSVLKLF
jgi:flagellin-like hook-associated protein FlgL